MNRLIIVGNGFDLAHKMKTTYKNFLLDYLRTSFVRACTHNKYDDELIEVQRYKHIPFAEQEIETIQDISIFQEFVQPTNALYSFGNVEDSYDSPTVPFVCTVKNAFFQKIFSECFSCNWVDIENEYYNSLKTLLGEKENSAKAKGIEELNKTFEFLIKLLESYLTKQPLPEGIRGYLNIFKEKILKEDVVTIKMEEDLEPTETLILNFNYTSTINAYYEYNRKTGGHLKMPQVNYIHGQLNDKENPIVFGFGDELDEDFKKIEGDKMKGFLNYIKSFFYFKTMNYHDLIRFIESDNYQVVILGHSCGLSDRTMLNMIFEHEKCKSIKIYYYGTKEKNNFTELTQEISRHFTHKGDMRRKIVPLAQSLQMPQA